MDKLNYSVVFFGQLIIYVSCIFALRYTGMGFYWNSIDFIELHKHSRVPSYTMARHYTKTSKSDLE